jgi:M6 family metalloprotease-like protein
MNTVDAWTRTTTLWLVGTLLLSCRVVFSSQENPGKSEASPFLLHEPNDWPRRSAQLEDSRRRLGPSTGEIRALLLMIRFPEHSQRQLPTPDQLKAVCEGPVAEYMNQQSYGQYKITGCDAYDWVEADNTEAYYSYNNYGRVTNEQLQPILYPALNVLDQTAAASNPNFWQQYDSDGDMAIDIVFGVHSGYGSEFGMTDCETGREPIQRIQSQAWNGMVDTGWVSSQETGLYSLQGYVVIHAMELACGNTTLTTGKMAHEWTHTLVGSPPDLYDLSVGGAGIGGYDIMSSAYGPTLVNGDVPGSMSPWMKMRTAWMNPQEIVADGTCTSTPRVLVEVPFCCYHSHLRPSQLRRYDAPVHTISRLLRDSKWISRSRVLAAGISNQCDWWFRSQLLWGRNGHLSRGRYRGFEPKDRLPRTNRVALEWQLVHGVGSSSR